MFELKIKKILNIKSLIILIATLLGNLLIIEFFAYGYFKNHSSRKIQNLSKNGINYDKRNRIEFIKDYQTEKNKNLYPSLSPGYFIGRNLIKDFLPLSDISNKVLLYCNESGQYVKYYSNDYGFRSGFSGKDLKERRNILRKGRSSHKSKNAIWLLGDSFVQGGCISDKSTFENTILKEYPEYKVFSFGRGGTSIGIQFAIFKEFVFDSLSKGDLVFIFHYPRNDFLEIRKESQNQIVNEYYSNDDFSQNLISDIGNKKKDDFMISYINKYIDYSEKTSKRFNFWNIIKFENTYKLLAQNELLRSILSKDRDTKSEKIYFSYLNKIADKTINKEAKLVLACIPYSVDLINKPINSNCSKSKELLKKYTYAKSLNIKFVNVEKILSNLVNKDLYPNGDFSLHFSDYGYIKYMENILEEVF